MEEKFKDIKDLVKEAGIDTPSASFLNKVMYDVKIIQSEQEKEYTPLISKRLWLVIVFVTVLFIGLIPFLSGTEKSIFTEINFSMLKKIRIDNPFSNFKFYKTTVYGIVFLAILFFIQIPFLKRRIDKNFS